jgi:hypothetical protein
MAGTVPPLAAARKAGTFWRNIARRAARYSRDETR